MFVELIIFEFTIERVRAAFGYLDAHVAGRGRLEAVTVHHGVLGLVE